MKLFQPKKGDIVVQNEKDVLFPILIDKWLVKDIYTMFGQTHVVVEALGDSTNVLVATVDEYGFIKSLSDKAGRYSIDHQNNTTIYLEVEESKVKLNCICELNQLMAFGCQCGAFTKEKTT